MLPVTSFSTAQFALESSHKLTEDNDHNSWRAVLGYHIHSLVIENLYYNQLLSFSCQQIVPCKAVIEIALLSWVYYIWLTLWSAGYWGLRYTPFYKQKSSYNRYQKLHDYGCPVLQTCTCTYTQSPSINCGGGSDWSRDRTIINIIACGGGSVRSRDYKNKPPSAWQCSAACPCSRQGNGGPPPAMIRSYTQQGVC